MCVYIILYVVYMCLYDFIAWVEGVDYLGQGVKQMAALKYWTTIKPMRRGMGEWGQVTPPMPGYGGMGAYENHLKWYQNHIKSYEII